LRGRAATSSNPRSGPVLMHGPEIATRLKLGDFPTPVHPLELGPGEPANLWIKRDDQTARRYGGNKVRKLELLLGEARAQRKTRILTFGAAGSHHVLAAAIYGKSLGFNVEAVLIPQHGSEHARENLRAGLALGLVAHGVPSWWAPIEALTSWDSDAYVIGVGG